MAVFDPTEQRMCLRVVYDGAAGAGKTTNVRQLGSLFAHQRATEVYSPAELCGRTLYFDWMQIAAGVVSGFPLLCQVVSVPGQAALAERRRHLLASADVVVVVCDSSKGAIERTRGMLPLTDELALPWGDPIPVVVQANKQDQRDAMDGNAIVARIGRSNVHVVEAIATEGIGVVDTFVAAVRSATRALQARLEQGALSVPVRRAEDERQLLAELARVPIDRYGAAELVLEEAAAAYLVGEAPPVEGGTADLVDFGDTSPPESASHVAAVVTKVAPLPRADVPTGFIWPAHTGRAMLRSLALSDQAPVGQGGAMVAVREHVLSTSFDQCFVDADSARQALVRAARERTQLEALLVSDTVLVVQPGADGTSWLWTIMPRTEPVTQWMFADPRVRMELLGAAMVDAAVVTLRHGLVFVPSLDAFGVQGGRLRYIGSLTSTEQPSASALELLVASVSQVTAWGLDVDLFLEFVARRLASRLRLEQRTSLMRECQHAASAASELLLRAIQRTSEAA